jgi:nitrite reductase (NADH) small subunit/3-phenylpropionate/trans-cinnamate dioxygenase ferredoxin subunit
MDGFVRVGKIADFPRGRARKVVVNGVPVAVFREGSDFVVVADACPHMGASLAEGKLEAGHVVCAWHGWKFDVRTGDSGRRSGAALDFYETRVSGDLWVKRKPAPPPDTTPPDEEDEFIPFDPEKHLRNKD